MEYEGQICRGPQERGAFMLPISVGCSYNACKFCGLFKHLNYRELPIEKIENELKRVSKLNRVPKKIFLGDGTAFSMDSKKLIKILKLINNYFPEVNTINCDATITSIFEKSDEDLIELKKLGINTLYIGIESGLDDTLRFMNKEHDTKMAMEQINRLKEHGINYAAHFMTGVSGLNKGEENAKALACFFNKLKPTVLVNFSIFLSSDDLLEDIGKGNYKPSTELDNLKEDLILLENLEFSKEDSVVYDSYHDWVNFHIKGTLPRDKEVLIDKLKAEIEKLSKLNDIYSNDDLTNNIEEIDSTFGFKNREYMGLIDVYSK